MEMPAAQGASIEDDTIVVVGLAARLPQDADTPAGLWKLLEEGRNTSSEMPSDRINVDAFYGPNGSRVDTFNVDRAHFVKGDLAAFDAPFFAIQPIEADSMDPQQRLVLETSYHALENAGIPLEKLSGSNTSVYIASSNRDYEAMLLRDVEESPKYMATGVGASLLANRVSWSFDLRGPSIAIDTACSGSLTGLSLARQSLRTKESDLALVGGVSLTLAPEVQMTQLSTMGFLSPDGLSYSFDSRANGYSKGEGSVIVVLKRLSDALRDNDTIRAVLRATSINQDGRTPGITQPSMTAQTSNIQRAYRDAGLDMDHTGYFEAHGTGTAVGDPIELQGIYNAFKRTATNPLHIGSLKANIGHLESAAGLAALVKSVQILERGVLPPNALHETTNPQIPEDDWGIKFLHAPKLFPPGPGGLRRVSINNFGYGGSNAHAVLDDALHFLKHTGISSAKHCTREHPIVLNGNAPNGINNEHSKNVNGASNGIESLTNGHHTRGYDLPSVLLWTAADSSGIERQREAFRYYLQDLLDSGNSVSSSWLGDLAYTLSRRRSELAWRSYTVCTTPQQLLKSLQAKSSQSFRVRGKPSLAFVFTGQGAQWAGMGIGLMKYPAFKRSIEHSAAYLKSLGCTWSLTEELALDQAISRINEPEFAQPLCTAVQIGLVDLLKSWNMEPSSVVGHSSGEIAAAYCAKALSHPSSIKVAYLRGLSVATYLRQQHLPGSMMAVATSEKDAVSLINSSSSSVDGKVVVGCVNSPTSVTLTGDSAKLQALQEEFQSRAIFARVLNVGTAYHSHHMEPIAPAYVKALGKLTRVDLLEETPGPRMFSSVKGQLISRDAASTGAYWAENLVSKVSFVEATQTLCDAFLEERARPGFSGSGEMVIVEIGPHGALQKPILDIVKTVCNDDTFIVEKSLTRGADPVASLADLAGRMRARGFSELPLTQVSSPGSCENDFQALSDLPQYCFDHSRTYWSEGRQSRDYRFRKNGRHELLGTPVIDFNPLRPQWRNLIRCKENPWIRDHQIGSIALYPASGMLAMVIEGARQLASTRGLPILGYQIDKVRFSSSISLEASAETLETQLHLKAYEESPGTMLASHEFIIFALKDSQWVEMSRGQIAVQYGNAYKDRPIALDARTDEVIRELRSSDESTGNVRTEDFYRALSAASYNFGPTFRSLSKMHCKSTGEAIASVDLDSWMSKTESSPIASHVIHPTDLDAVFQTAAQLQSKGGTEHIPLLVPTAIESLWISNDLLHRDAGAELRVHTSRAFKGFNHSDFQTLAIDQTGNVRLRINGLRLTSLATGSMTAAGRPTAKRMNYSISWRPDVDLLSASEAQEICERASPIRRKSSSLVDQLRKQVDDRDVPYPDQSPLLSNGNCTVPGAVALQQILPYIKLMAHKNPALKILELGAGTGGYTSLLIDCLTEHTDSSASGMEAMRIPMYSNYTFTDTDSAKLAAAQEQFGHQLGLDYKLLDIEEDPSSQGIALHTYDMVVCGSLLRATKVPQRALCNVRQLLKHTGCALLVEPTICTESHTALKTFVLDAGFAGVHIEMPGHGDPTQRKYSSLLARPAAPLQQTSQMIQNGETKRKVQIVVSGDSPLQESVAALLQDDMIALGRSAEIVAEHELRAALAIGFDIIVLLELETTYFRSVTDYAWETMRRLLTSSSNIYWVAGSRDQKYGHPFLSLTKGLIRTLQHEHPDTKATRIVIDADNEASSIANRVLKIFSHLNDANSEALDIEYEERDGLFNIPRLIPDRELDQLTHHIHAERFPRMQAFSTGDRALEMAIWIPGMLDTIYFRDCEDARTPLCPGEVEIENMATGLDSKDYLIAAGSVAGDKFAVECAGIVTRSCSTQFVPGDRVCCFASNGALKTYVRADASAVIKLPPRLSFVEAAALPMAFATAYYALVTVANLQDGESVLLHSGTSAVTQAAIQIAQRLNARIYATETSDEGRAILEERYKIPHERIIDISSGSLSQQIRAQEDEGIDIILNTLSGEQQLQAWRCIAPLGRFVELGQADIEASKRGLPMGPFSRNVTFSSVNLAEVSKRSKRTMRRIMSGVERLIGDVHNPIELPHPLQKYSIGKVEDAFRSLQKSNGKTVLEVGKADLVLVTPSHEPAYHFDENATYVIAGGLGGLGRSMVRWMVGRKARHFLLLSRSGPASNAAAMELLDELRQKGVAVYAPRCDVCNGADVARAIEECTQKNFPPIKGLIQACMVLKDRLFQNMSSDRWHAALAPKVDGTINLLTHLPQDLDFCVLLSSIASVTGMHGQANYAAGNNFLNEIARQRAAQGKHCVSLDLGIILSVGYSAEQDIIAGLRTKGFEGVSEREFLALLDYACDPHCAAARDPARAQVVTGLAGAESFMKDQLQDAYFLRAPLFAQLWQLVQTRHRALHGAGGDGDGDGEKATRSPAVLLAEAQSKEAARAVLGAATVARFARLLTMQPQDVDAQRPVSAFGVDSLVSLELRAWIKKEFAVDVGVLDILAARSLQQLADSILMHDKRWGSNGQTNGAGKAIAGTAL